MKFDKFTNLMKTMLREDKDCKLLAERMNNPNSRFRVSCSGKNEVLVEYPDKNGYPQERWFVLSDMSLVKVTNFLKEKYLNIVRFEKLTSP